ncbi:MAG: CGGC domain-containing protein [Clostridium sp.]|nr:CGGC domain-containing protein [Clostridium sp.]
MKIGIIRCMQTEDMCPGTACFKVVRERKLAFESVGEDIEIIGINTCGGCPGKKAVIRANKMVERGADTIVLASCITKGTPIGFPCPHREQIRLAIEKRLGSGIKIINYTH